jgi:5-oxoprolinase (ATP-hydrolysing) subunit A
MDLNADLGEDFRLRGLDLDLGLLDVVTSGNVACGFHAGDPTRMRLVCEAAAARDVAIGAQVSYRDLVGFGRRFIDYDIGELRDDLLYQIGALDAFARRAGTRVGYVKPHGALYNRTVTDRRQAGAVVAAVADYARSLPVLGLPGSLLLEVAAERGLPTVPEGFADRAYLPSGELVPRGEPGAVLSDPAEISARAVRMATDRVVVAVDGTAVSCPVESMCVHGDTPGAVAIAGAVRDAITAAGIAVAPFTAPRN